MGIFKKAENATSEVKQAPVGDEPKKEQELSPAQKEGLITLKRAQEIAVFEGTGADVPNLIFAVLHEQRRLRHLIERLNK
jgi:hypothetical protein